GSRLVNVASGASLGDLNGHREYQLAAGNYQVEVQNSSDIGSYRFVAYVIVPTGAILARWNASDGALGALGAPTAVAVCEAEVCWQDFKNGQIVAAGNSAWITRDAIRLRWIAAGGPSGALGTPTGQVFATTKENGFGQHFVGGEIYGTEALGAHSVQSPILATWKAAGWENGTYGYPTEEQTCTDTECSQVFQGGTITAAK
ncbi:MAG: hypothetical protein K4304_07730, partial [Propionicimonas sp.]